MSLPPFVSFNVIQGLDQKQQQHLMMLPRMQQAIRILQMPILELSSAIAQEIEQNPILEYSEEATEDEEIEESDWQKELEIIEQLTESYSDVHEITLIKSLENDKKRILQENTICSTETLYETLMQQAHEAFNSQELNLAQEIIGNFDEKGFLKVSLEEIASTNDSQLYKLSQLLERIQKFDPPGVGARDQQESLLIQLKAQGKENSLAYQLIANHYDDLLHHRMQIMSRHLHTTLNDIIHAVKEDVSKLSLDPGSSYSQEPVSYIIPDIHLHHENDELVATTNGDYIPPLKLNYRYLHMLKDESISKETKAFIRHHILSAKWLMRTIGQRNDTLLKIAKSLAEHQKEFFKSGNGKLKPLTMQELAQELGLNESTIVRAVANKYLESPRGLISLRDFFTYSYKTESGDEISSRSVKEMIKDIVDQEDKSNPLSDETISKRLKEKGISCARRTVAKYRNEMHILKALDRTIKGE